MEELSLWEFAAQKRKTMFSVCGNSYKKKLLNINFYIEGEHLLFKNQP